MGRFEHLSMVAFLILGLAMVRLMTSCGALIARNIISHEIEDREKERKTKSKSELLAKKMDGLRKQKTGYELSPVRFYWVHNLLVTMVFFTMIIFWWNAYPLNNTKFMPDSKWNLFLYLLFLFGPFLLFLICDVILPFNRDEKDMAKIMKGCEKEVYKMYQEAVDEEKRWATYLFSQGSMIGLSEKLLHKFVEYMANRRMKSIGLEPQYDQKTNPLPWVDHWLNSKSMQNAPQETEIESYVIGGIKQDVSSGQFKKFKL